MPMLADFAVRLALGLAVLLLLVPWRVVPPAFFRTQGVVMLGLLVLAALALSQEQARGWPVTASAVGAALAFAVSVAWGLGLPYVAAPLTAVLAAVAGGVLVAAPPGAGGALDVLNAAGRLTSGCLMGATLTAMLLGHYYLTAPAMSIAPLRRAVQCMAWALGARALVAVLAWWAWRQGMAGSHAGVSSLFLAMRWGMGFGGPLLAWVLTWKTVAIRSTQSATGILYIAMMFVLFGELSALVLGRETGIAF
jgi:hypothetical protein